MHGSREVMISGYLKLFYIDLTLTLPDLLILPSCLVPVIQPYLANSNHPGYVLLDIPDGLRDVVV